MSEPEAVRLILDDIHDPDYMVWKTAIKHHKLTLDEHILQFRERADDINSSQTNRKRLRQHSRRLAGKCVTPLPDSDSEPETEAPKKVRCQKVRRNGVKEIKLTDKGLVSIPAKEWYDDLEEAEHDYIQVHNAKVKHNESTIDLTPPTKLKLIRQNGTKLALKIQDKKKGEDESSDSETEEPTMKTDCKKIRFNLKARDVKNWLAWEDDSPNFPLPPFQDIPKPPDSIYADDSRVCAKPTGDIMVVDAGGSEYSTIADRAWHVLSNANHSSLMSGYQSGHEQVLSVVNAVTKAYIEGRD